MMQHFSERPTAATIARWCTMPDPAGPASAARSARLAHAKYQAKYRARQRAKEAARRGRKP